MFNRLPPELVRQIIESAIPFNFDIYTYDDRQATLRAICLVSRRFAQIAQPILFEVVWCYGRNLTTSSHPSITVTRLHHSYLVLKLSMYRYDITLPLRPSSMTRRLR